MIAKEFYNGDWDAVTDLNIYTLNHRFNFLIHKQKKNNTKK